MEKKQRILDLLLPALQATDNLSDLQSLRFVSDKEIVVAAFPCGEKIVNVAMDSGTSMIKDILSKIL